MSEDRMVTLIAGVLVVAHLGLLVWYWFRRDLTPMLALNALVSGGVMLYWAPRLGEVFRRAGAVTGLVAFEVAVLATALAAFAQLHVPLALILVEFAGNAILSAGALHFILTFKIKRLF